MSDGVIRIKIDVDGKELELTNKDLDKVEKSSHKAGAGIKQFATSLGLVAIGAMAFKTLKDSMDDAISRFDTLNKFPKVLQALGVSAEDSERAMSNLADGIDGLPTKLDDIAHTAQRMYTSFNDIDKATDSALALNNALLASGADAEAAKRGTEMYLKVLQTGQMDLVTWRSLQQNMSLALVKVSEAFGMTEQEMYQALQSGSVSIDQFNNKLIELGTGTGELVGLARENTLGIATSFENLKTAAVRGLVEIIDAFNKLSQDVTGKEIAQNIDSLKRIVFSSFQAIAKAIEATTPVVILFADGVKLALPVVQALTPAIIGLMTAYGAYVVITRASTAIQLANAALKTAMTTTVGASSAMASLTIVQQASTKAAQADMLIRALQNKQITLGTLAIGLLTGKVTLAIVAQMAMTAASTALGAAIRFMMGPIGWVVAGIGLLTAGAIALVKWFNRSTEEGERLSKETENLSESTDGLVDSVNQSGQAFAEQQRDIEVTTRKNEELAEKVTELAEKESLSAAEKEKMNTYINQLNESMDGLNLAYDEESEALSMTSEQLEARIGLMEDLDNSLSVQERLNELTEEQIAIEMQLEDTIALRKEWDEKLKEGTVTGKEHTEAVEDLNAKEIELKDTLGELGDQQEVVEKQMTESMNNITEAIKNGTAEQMISLDMFSEKQREVIDSLNEKWLEYQEHTTDMFDTLSDEIEITASEMADNLEENQRIVGEWADGIAELAERGVDDGLLEKLREAGPESAGHVNALVNASDEELSHLNEVFKEGGDVATDALAKSLGIENTEIMDAVGHLVAETGNTLKDEIANAGFDDIGIDVAKGLAEGTKEGTPEAESAAEDMAKNTTDAAKSEFGVQSPSTVFKGIGEDLTSGLALGIGSGTGDVVKAIMNMFKNVEKASQLSFDNMTSGYKKSISQMSDEMAKLPVAIAKEMTAINQIMNASSVAQTNAMTRLAQGYNRGGVQIAKELTLMNKIVDASMKAMQRHISNQVPSILGTLRALAGSMPRPFNGLQSQFNFIGLSAMNGLTAGLIRGSRGAINQARYTANQIKSTMQSALKVKSPSRVMRDEVGKWIPEGIAVGIKENAKSVYNALENLSKDMILPASPEVALGTHKLGYSSMNAASGHQGIQKTENKYNTANMKGMFDGAVFNVRDDNDIPKLAKELNDYIKKSARKGGVVMP